MRVQCTCRQCGVAFMKKASDVRRGSGLFCSQACYRRPLDDRFWPRVNKTGPVPAHRPELGPCWLWTGSCTLEGYGKLGHQYRTLLAHRVSWEMAHGQIAGGLWVLHECDTPPCVNPFHLRLGTPVANYEDMVGKGRQSNARPRGVQSGRAKLNDAAVREIRQRFAQGGVTKKALAVVYGVSAQIIYYVVIGKTWRHVE